MNNSNRDMGLSSLIEKETDFKRKILTLRSASDAEVKAWGLRHNKKNIHKDWIKNYEKSLENVRKEITSTMNKITLLKKVSARGEIRSLQVQKKIEITDAVTEEFRKGQINEINETSLILIGQEKELEALRQKKQKAEEVTKQKKVNFKETQREKKKVAYAEYLASLDPKEKTIFTLKQFGRKIAMGLSTLAVGYMAYQYLIQDVNVPLNVFTSILNFTDEAIVPFVTTSFIGIGVFVGSLLAVGSIANLLGFIQIGAIRSDVQKSKLLLENRFQDFQQKVHGEPKHEFNMEDM